MQELLRWLASWKGITVEDGAELHFEFSSFPAGGLGLLVLIGLLLALVFVVFVYRRDGKNLKTWQRVLLGALRAVAVLAAVFMLLEPNLVAVKKETRPGHTLLLLDTSQSMTHLDAWRRDNVQAMASGWRDVGVADVASATRMDLAKALLGYKDGELVRKLAARNQAQLYGFNSNIEALPLVAPPPLPADAPPPQAAPTPLLDLAKIDADGRFSNLGGSVRTALEKSRSSEIAAVVILSDGRRNVGPQGAEVARLLNQRKVPHTFVLGLGDPSETQTVGLTRFEAPEKVFQKDPFTMRASVGSQGYDLTSITVKLVRVDDKGVVQQVRSQQIAVGGNKPDVDVEFADLTSDETGRFTYRVELQPPDGEPPSPERHQKSAIVEVLAQRTRVLLIAGGANFEYQILRHLLIRDKTIDVSCWLQSADADFPQDGDEDVRIDKLPEDRTQLDPYDVVIMIDPDSSKLTPTFCNLLRQQIENGCGLWWVCGEKFTLDAIRPGAPTEPLVSVLPVVLDLRKADTEILGFNHAFAGEWPYHLTPEGEDGLASKIAKIAESKDESRLLWGRLPGLHFAFPVLRPKPAATVIAEHTNPKFRQGDEGMAVIATQFFGAGRVLYNGTDETYRWRSRYENAYDRFWVNGVRYLFEGRVNAGNSRMRLLVSDDKIELGEAIKLAVEAKDEGFRPLIAEGFDVTLEQDGKSQETLHLVPVAEAPGKYELTLRPTATGFYRVRSVLKYGREVEASFQVVPAQIESEGPVDRAELAAIAGCNGGRLCETPQQLLAALDQIPSRSATDTFRTPHAVWDGWVTVAFMLTALALEWYLRKRFNLL